MSATAQRVTDDAQVHQLLRDASRIVVLGIKPESHASQPAHSVPAYMAAHGYEIVPAPVRYPEVTTILDTPVQRDLRAISGPVDILNVFLKPQDIPQHVEAIIALHPATVWLQLGIRHDEVADQLVEAGINVIQDRCIKVDHMRSR